MKYLLTFALIGFLFWLKPPRPDYILDCNSIRVVEVDFRPLRQLRVAHFIPAPPELLTLSPYIIVQKGYHMHRAEFAHETVHIVQEERDGWLFYPKYIFWYVKFYVVYLWKNWGQPEVSEAASWYAYRNIPYEQEGMAAEDIPLNFVLGNYSPVNR